MFPGWEFYAGVAGAQHTVLDLMPNASVFVDEPDAVAKKSQEWWDKLLDRHDRSGVGSLVRPEELYIPPSDWNISIKQRPGASLEQLSLNASAIDFETKPTVKFHGSVPAMVEEIQRVTASGNRTLFAVANQGEVERVAEIFSEYRLPFRIGSKQQSGGETYLDETALLGTGETATVIVRAFVLDGALG